MKKKYRGFTIELTQTNPDRVYYKITRTDGSMIESEDAEGYAVDLDEAFEMAKESLDDFLDN